MNKWKRLLIEIAGIVLVSFVFSIVYNYFSPKPLPLIRQEKKVQTLSDSLLNALMVTDTTHTNQFKSSDLKLRDSVSSETENKIDKRKDTLKSNEEIANNEPVKQKLMTFTYKQLLKYLNNPNVVIIDARGEEEFEKGHIGNAINIYAYMADQNKYFALITTLPQNKIYIIYCDGGNCDASHKLTEDIVSFGFKNVYLYSGGWDEWSKKQGISQ